MKGVQGSCVAMGACCHANLFVGAAHRGPRRRLARAPYHAAQRGIQRQPSPPRSSKAGAGHRRHGGARGLSAAHGAFLGESGATLVAWSFCFCFCGFVWDGRLTSWLVGWLIGWNVEAKNAKPGMLSTPSQATNARGAAFASDTGGQVLLGASFIHSRWKPDASELTPPAKSFSKTSDVFLNGS